jgi:hypothetical protein
MDDHFPAGFYHPEKGTIFHPAPSPYGIPYRSLYSRNIRNLFCAGRNHSASHVAMSSTRVMATCSVMGQAVGTAAAIAARKGLGPRGVYEQALRELQETLMADDAWLPFLKRPVSPLTKEAHLALVPAAGLVSAGRRPDGVAQRGATPGGDIEMLRNGVDRPAAEGYNGWTGETGTAIQFSWDAPRPVSGLRLVFDSDLNRKDDAHGKGYENRSTAKNMRHYYARDLSPWSVPQTLVKQAVVEVDYGDGRWQEAGRLENNYQRLVRLPMALEEPVAALRLVPTETWGDPQARIHSIDVV